MKRRSNEDVMCWVCDYGYVFLALLVLLVCAFLFRERWLPPSVPPVTPTPTLAPTQTALPATLTPAFTLTPFPTFTRTITRTPTPAPKPEFILVFVPIQWSASQEEFEQEANRQAGLFISASGMENYFRIRIEKLSSGPKDISLSSDTLVSDVIRFGAQKMPGDRYIGLTNGDIKLNGRSNVAGWTMGLGGIGVVVEAGGISVTAHELGHTFGLCDEYSYTYWKDQNARLAPASCPNPFPSQCSQTSGEMCLGAPTESGKRSIMGPSSPRVDYGFNTPSLNHLRKVFGDLTREAAR